MSKPLPMSALTLLALLLSTPTSAPLASKPGATRPRDFLSELLAGAQPCNDPACKACHPAPEVNGDSAAASPVSADNLMASAGFSQPETPVPQESVSRIAWTSLSACRAVSLTDAATGPTAQLKGAAAMLITSLEGARDSYLPGDGSRADAEAHIAAVAQACRWALIRHTPDAS